MFDAIGGELAGSARIIGLCVVVYVLVSMVGFIDRGGLFGGIFRGAIGAVRGSLSGIRLTTGVFRTVSAAHPLARAVVGIAVAIVAWAGLRRADTLYAFEPPISGPHHLLGWCGVGLAAYLTVPGLWAIAGWLANRSGPPAHLTQTGPAKARSATESETQENLEGKASGSPRPKFLD